MELRYGTAQMQHYTGVHVHRALHTSVQALAVYFQRINYKIWGLAGELLDHSYTVAM